MANMSLTEQLDQAVQALIADRGRMPPIAVASIEPLINIAAELRELPREAFREQLKNDLERRAEMSKETGQSRARESERAGSVQSVREGFRTVTPYLAIRHAQEVIDFVQAVFGAKGRIYGIGYAGGFHSEYKIGDSMVMIGGGEN